MEKLFFICLSIFLVSCAGSQQTAGISDSSAPSNTNVIFVHTDLDAKSAYKKVAQTLQTRGYTFRSTDETLKTISTEFTGVSQRWGVDNTFVRIGANIQNESNSKIAIRGWWKTLENEDTETGQTIKKFGQNSSPARNAWKEMYQVANSLGDSLSFQTN
ncbi:hypothetical protein [Fodinibius sp. SL11]|uniref:hypothetical protein n=1 Tax=Fodinibius sp. SL11 TaxID=3425690 RepID=UPI003F883108